MGLAFLAIKNAANLFSSGGQEKQGMIIIPYAFGNKQGIGGFPHGASNTSEYFAQSNVVLAAPWHVALIPPMFRWMIKRQPEGVVFLFFVPTDMYQNHYPKKETLPDELTENDVILYGSQDAALTFITYGTMPPHVAWVIEKHKLDANVIALPYYNNVPIALETYLREKKPSKILFVDENSKYGIMGPLSNALGDKDLLPAKTIDFRTCSKPVANQTPASTAAERVYLGEKDIEDSLRKMGVL